MSYIMLEDDEEENYENDDGNGNDDTDDDYEDIRRQEEEISKCLEEFADLSDVDPNYNPTDDIIDLDEDEDEDEMQQRTRKRKAKFTSDNADAKKPKRNSNSEESENHKGMKQCPTCNVWVKHASYNRHMKLHENILHKCPFIPFTDCNASYKRTDGLMLHIKKIHKNDIVLDDKDWNLTYPKLLPLIQAELSRMYPLKATQVITARTTSKRQIQMTSTPQLNIENDFVQPLLDLPLETRSVLRNFFVGLGNKLLEVQKLPLVPPPPQPLVPPSPQPLAPPANKKPRQKRVIPDANCVTSDFSKLKATPTQIADKTLQQKVKQTVVHSNERSMPRTSGLKATLLLYNAII